MPQSFCLVSSTLSVQALAYLVARKMTTLGQQQPRRGIGSQMYKRDLPSIPPIRPPPSYFMLAKALPIGPSTLGRGSRRGGLALSPLRASKSRRHAVDSRYKHLSCFALFLPPSSTYAFRYFTSRPSTTLCASPSSSPPASPPLSPPPLPLPSQALHHSSRSSTL